jgi:hypothetical protein
MPMLFRRTLPGAPAAAAAGYPKPRLTLGHLREGARLWRSIGGKELTLELINAKGLDLREDVVATRPLAAGSFIRCGGLRIGQVPCAQAA